MEDKIVLDKDEALNMFEDDDEFFKELAETFINDAIEQMSVIAEAVNSLNSKAIQESAHKLKGAAANFGKNATTDTAFKLETLGKENRLDEAEEVYKILVKDVERLVNALKEFIE